MTDWSKLKVAELKDELKSRGVPLTGLKLKADFVAKLNETETSAIAEAAEEEIETDAGPEPERLIAEPRDELAVAEHNAPPEKQLNKEENAQAFKDLRAIEEAPVEQVLNVTLPEDVDMYFASQFKPTPSQPLTQMLAARNEAKAERDSHITPPPAKGDIPSEMSIPVPANELIEDSKKRKRRSVTPPPSTQDVALKKARARDGTPVITKQESSLEQLQAATDAAEAVQAPDGLGDDVPIKADVPGPQGQANTRPSQSIENIRGNEQAAPRSPSPKREVQSHLKHDRSVPSALHPATRSLYLRNFKRPLQAPALRTHLTELAQSSQSSTEGSITVFHLDNIRTHALVSFDSITTASRVRSLMHQTIFPEEASRMPIWVDFIPDNKVEGWINIETASSDRSKKWEVVYKNGPDSVNAVHQQVDAGPPRKPSAAQPRHISISEALSRPPMPAAPGIHPDRATMIPRQDRGSYDRGIPSLPESKRAVIPASDAGTGFKALDELFSSTTAKPKLYYKQAPTSIVEDRLDMIKDLRVGHSEMGRSGDPGMKRYSFEIHKGREAWVDKGPEFGFGRTGVDALEGRRGRGGGGGGGYRGSRGDRGRGGDSWRGKY